MLVVQYFDPVAVEDGDDRAGDVGGVNSGPNNDTKAALNICTRPLLILIGKVMTVSELLHLLGVLIYHQVGIGRSIKHNVAS
jgi:hypothetical protein